MSLWDKKQPTAPEPPIDYSESLRGIEEAILEVGARITELNETLNEILEIMEKEE